VTAVAQQRGIVDRVLGLARPAVVGDFTPPTRAVADGLWVVARRIRLPGGITIATNMTVVRLRSGLLVYSPFRLDAPMRADLAGMGRVAHLVAPNAFHYLYLGQHRDAFPEAAVYLCPALRERRPVVGSGTVLGEEPPAAWGGEVDVAVLGPSRGVSEVALYHRATRTLIVTDLAFNMQSVSRRPDRWYWQMSGVWQRFGPSKLVQHVLLRDADLVRPFLARVLAWDFDRIVVSHGDVVERDGHALFAAAFARWR
jgi:hypothetical protein